MYRIFIVEDDINICNEMANALEKWGNSVVQVRDFNDVISEFLNYSPHIVLMDIKLPFYNGFYWCGEIRKISKVPIIFISTDSENMNILMAINMGGDDFIGKPFDFDVLNAKVQALLRRTYDYHSKNMLLEHGKVILDINSARVHYKNKSIDLTKNEFQILQMLMENTSSIVEREVLMKKLWDHECFVDDNTLTVNMNRLRNKLGQIEVIDFIKTKKGIGYVIV
ncbi:MAG: DNA-binding response regulator [Firmicutes bacterium HGW-Firmicutes-7]|nr:MAG: DNA-binding response regulator [Firmicutes bacterium HGW-Firmicutes-7]